MISLNLGKKTKILIKTNYLHCSPNALVPWNFEFQ